MKHVFRVKISFDYRTLYLFVTMVTSDSCHHSSVNKRAVKLRTEMALLVNYTLGTEVSLYVHVIDPV